MNQRYHPFSTAGLHPHFYSIFFYAYVGLIVIQLATLPDHLMIIGCNAHEFYCQFIYTFLNQYSDESKGY